MVKRQEAIRQLGLVSDSSLYCGRYRAFLRGKHHFDLEGYRKMKEKEEESKQFLHNFIYYLREVEGKTLIELGDVMGAKPPAVYNLHLSLEKMSTLIDAYPEELVAYKKSDYSW